VTERQQLDSFIGRFTPQVASVTRAAFRWLRKKFPHADVLVYDNYNALAIGFGPNHRASEAAFSIAVFPRWVNLCFLQGISLPDPHKRLTGSGKQVRNIRLDSAQVLDEPVVVELLETAAAQMGMSARAGAGKIIIKSISAKQRPRQPRAAAGGRR
jgi:hypothetical protein